MEYVWYASYGSNLHHDRFLCYIEGGTPEGSEKTEIGCTDPTNPVKSEKEMLPYPLYFAKQSQRWQNEGVAFIGTKPIANTETYSRKYLITKEQFLEVVQQENNGIDVSLDLKQVMANGSHTFDPSAWYGVVVYTGMFDGYPVFTFTSPAVAQSEHRPPSVPYLTMIIRGLLAMMPAEKVLDYLSNNQDIALRYSKDDLWQIIEQSNRHFT